MNRLTVITILGMITCIALDIIICWKIKCLVFNKEVDEVEE